MKRILTSFIFLLLAAASLAYQAKIDGIYYNFSGTEATVTYYSYSSSSNKNAYTGSVVIPETVTYNGTTYTVTSIGKWAFDGCSGLTSVTIPNSVTSIGGGAFEGCSGLTSVTIPNSVTSIEESAFGGCSGLKKVIVDDIAAWCNISFSSSDTNPLYYAHHIYSDENTEITDLVIPNSVTSIGDYAFEDCSGLTSVTIPNSVTSIGKYAFDDCSGLEKVIVDDIAAWCNISFSSSDTNPLYYAHHIYSDENTEITNLVIPNSVTSIGWGAFRGCSGLTSVTISDSVTSIGGSVFRGCSGLTSVAIPNSVTSIEDYAFEDCSGLTSVTIPNSVTSIGKYAFYGCESLTSVAIPNSVKTIGSSAFSGCSNLTSIEINSNAILSKSYTSSYSVKNIFGTQVQNYIIGNDVTSIGNYAFKGCSGLTSVTIPNSVTSIGYSAFNSCDALKKVIVKDIAAWCNISFDNNDANPLANANHLYSDENTEITDLIIPDGVTSIGSRAFYGCSGLTSISIPNSVTTIGEYVFDYCSRLTSVTIPNSVTTIGEYTFYECRGLTSITIPNSVTSIGHDAFKYCTSLISITIPHSVTSIGYDAFKYCTSLISITIPHSVTSIGYDAFEYCNGLKKVVVKDIAAWCNISFGNIFANPLYKAKHLYSDESTEITDLVLPNSVTSIGGLAFRGCSGLNSVTIPSSVKSIGEYAFYQCSGLEKVRISSGVTSISDYAFSDCSALTTVTIPNSVTSIGEYAFKNCMSLTSINALINIPKELNINVFSCDLSGYDVNTIYYIANLYVPRGRTAIYKNIAGWKLFSSITEKDFAYELTYVVDGVVYKRYEIQAGMTVTPEGYPVKEGFVFSGWDSVPKTMPENDVVVYGYFTPFTDLTPFKEEVDVAFGEELQEEKKLSGIVINNVYYNIDASDGSGYEQASGSIVLNTAMSNEQVDALVGTSLSDESVRTGFNGIVFKVPAGNGKITVDVKTLGSYALNIKVGAQEPQRITQIERGKVSFSYSVDEPTMVYLYAGTAATGARGQNEMLEQQANGVQLYGFTWSSNTTGIEAIENSQLTDEKAVSHRVKGIYTLTGVKVSDDAADLKTLPRGIYIVNGRKVAVK